MESSGSGRPPRSRADADPSHTQPLHRGDLHTSASPVVSDRVQEKMINACPAERNEKHGTGRSSPHFWRGTQGQESKEKQSQSPQIHCGVKLSHKHAPANQNEPHHSDTKCIQTLKWHPRGVTFSFSNARDGFPMFAPASQHSGKGQACGTGCQCAGNLQSLWKPSRNVSTDCLPALCSMPTLAVCWGLDVPDRPSYKDRECSEPMKRRHSLSDVNGEI